jgi:hypothetical protein
MPNQEIQDAMSKQINDLDEECKVACENLPNGEFELG